MVILIGVLVVIALSIQGFNMVTKKQTNDTGKVRVSWDPNRETDLLGYRIHYGQSSHNYIYHIKVGNVTSQQVINLTTDRRWYFVVTAYDTAYNESGYSNEASIYLPSSGEGDTTIVEVNLGFYNFPNPFNPDKEWTNIRYYLTEDQLVSISIYDNKENLVIHLVNNELRYVGEHFEPWDGKDSNGMVIRNGIYYAVMSLETGRKMAQISVLR